MGGSHRGFRVIVMFLFLNWMEKCRCVFWGWRQGVQGRVLSDNPARREDLDKLWSVHRAIFPCGSILNANNADSEFLEKANLFSIFYLRSRRDKMFLCGAGRN